jgi:NAD(P) transhydrogenase
MSSAFDAIVIGSGPGGEKAAMQAAKLRRRVALVDRGDRLGGNCLHTATIPSKTLRETILYIAGVRQRSLYGIQTTLGKHVTVEDLVRRKDAVIAGQTRCSSTSSTATRWTFVRGMARFLDPHRLEVVEPGGARRELSADTIVIATGSRPARDRPSRSTTTTSTTATPSSASTCCRARSPSSARASSAASTPACSRCSARA